MTKTSEAASEALRLATTESTEKTSGLFDFFTFKRLRGGLLFVVGYLLSPLCWWNDLIFNLPVAYGVGYLCSLASINWFLPGLIAGYWLSNVLGFVLMQFGAIDALQKEAKPRNLRKELLTGIISSTLYTLVILALVQFHIVSLDSLLPTEVLHPVL
jgi:hypothetical protein